MRELRSHIAAYHRSLPPHTDSKCCERVSGSMIFMARLNGDFKERVQGSRHLPFALWSLEVSPHSKIIPPYSSDPLIPATDPRCVVAVDISVGDDEAAEVFVARPSNTPHVNHTYSCTQDFETASSIPPSRDTRRLGHCRSPAIDSWRSIGECTSDAMTLAPAI